MLESTVDLLEINIDFDIDLLVHLLLFVKLTNSAVCTALELCSELLAIFVQPEMEVDVRDDQRLLKVCFSLKKIQHFFPIIGCVWRSLPVK